MTTPAGHVARRLGLTPTHAGHAGQTKETENMTADQFASEDATYRVAFALADGRFDVVEEFAACDTEAANAYAERRYAGQEWYVLDADGRNINGGRDQT